MTISRGSWVVGRGRGPWVNVVGKKNISGALARAAGARSGAP